MKKTEQRTLRLTPETVAKAEELSKLWNPAPDVVARISLADVVSTCINRIHKQEVNGKENH
jgi:hypothetical protein